MDFCRSALGLPDGGGLVLLLCEAELHGSLLFLQLGLGRRSLRESVHRAACAVDVVANEQKCIVEPRLEAGDVRLHQTEVAQEFILPDERVQRDALREKSRIGLGGLEGEIRKAAGLDAELRHASPLDRGEVGHRGKHPLELVQFCDDRGQLLVRERGARERILGSRVILHHRGGAVAGLCGYCFHVAHHCAAVGFADGA